MMRLEWSTSQQRKRSLFRNFGATELEPGALKRDNEATFDLHLWQHLADLGFWKSHVPKRFGGDGGSIWDFVASFEGLATGTTDFAFLLSVIAHAGLVQVLLDHGDDTQCATHLPCLISGGVGATAATEPGGGSHISNVKTQATRVDDVYTLSGEKAHITNAPIANLTLIVGRIPELGKNDITLFLVERGQEGLTFEPPEDLLGQRASPTGWITMSNVRVTADDIVGDPGAGLTTLYSFLSFDRLMYGLLVSGSLEPLLIKAVERVQTRHAFGKPLGEHEYIQEKLVDMKLTMEAARWLSYSTVAALDRKDPFANPQSSLAKLMASEGMVRAGLELIQIFGHLGYDRNSGIERILRDAVALRIAGGTTEMQKKNIFKHLLVAYAQPQKTWEAPQSPEHENAKQMMPVQGGDAS